MIRKLLLIILLPCVSFALTKDAEQKLNITSDAFEYSKRDNSITYIGNVIATQGTTRVTADRAIVAINQKNQIDHLIATGNPATYRTQIDEKHPPLTASANTLKYFPIEDRLELIKNGHITQNGNSFDAPHILFDMKKETLISKPIGGGRTTIVLQPQRQVKK